MEGRVYLHSELEDRLDYWHLNEELDRAVVMMSIVKEIRSGLMSVAGLAWAIEEELE